MHIGDVLPAEYFLHRRRQIRRRYHPAGAIDNTVVASVSPDQMGSALHQHRRSIVLVRGAITSFRVQKDRPGLGMGLKLRKRPVGENEKSLALGHIVKAMAAGNAVTVGDAALRRHPIGVGFAGLKPAGLVGRHGNETDIGHLAILAVTPIDYRSTGSATRFLRNGECQGLYKRPDSRAISSRLWE